MVRPMADTERISEPGVYTLPDAAYHGDPCPGPSLSSSVAKTNDGPLAAPRLALPPASQSQLQTAPCIEYLGPRLGSPSGASGKLMGRGRDL